MKTALLTILISSLFNASVEGCLCEFFNWGCPDITEPTTTEAPCEFTHLCGDIDAVAASEDGTSFYVFKDQYVSLIELKDEEGYVESFNEETSSVFENMPEGAVIDAAIMTSWGGFLLIVDELVYLYEPDFKLTGTGDLRVSEFTNIDAAAKNIWGTENDVFYFSGSQYAEHNGQQTLSGYPKDISADWNGLPDNVDGAYAAFGELRIFKGNQMWVYNDDSKTPTEGSPYTMPDNFFVSTPEPELLSKAKRFINGLTL